MTTTKDDAINGTNPITVNGKTEFTTGADGTLVISSLNAGKENSRVYWVKETQAPAGYTLPEGAAGVHEVTVVAGANAEVVLTVDNMKQDRPGLPLTGSTGTALFVLGGGALVALALGMAARKRRENRLCRGRPSPNSPATRAD